MTGSFKLLGQVAGVAGTNNDEAGIVLHGLVV
jgi:hypothetical protein